ncbi:hypothetical protein CK501_13410 [Halovibrio salipaludis]|uniref:Uncharacterized protein n=1 Tax=Halovibrio salipaludis TaxID=2032626 RepID=A0A2A2F1N2_9GAMM|nr:hypothetical protein [Halovibrio salipaludis]PAU78680.1 hypothetical protein CK501_13410 [Halovibrio salipaludis]
MEDWHNATEPHLIKTPNAYPERIAPVGEAALAQSRRLAALAGSVRGPIELCRGGALAARGLAEQARLVAETATGHAHELWLVPVLALIRNGDAVCRTMRAIRADTDAAVCWFLLESTGAELLASVVQAEGLMAWSELIGDPSIALMVAHDGPPESRVPAGAPRMRHSLRVPASCAADVLAWCRQRQPAMEAWLGMPVEQSALEVAVNSAATSQGEYRTFGSMEEGLLGQEADPGHVLSVLSAAAAMVRFEWACGPVRLQHLTRRQAMDEQAELVSLARGDTPGYVLDHDASVERAALDVEWHEKPPELVLDQAAVVSWLEGTGAASSAQDAFWYDARCLNKEVTRE